VMLAWVLMLLLWALMPELAQRAKCPRKIRTPQRSDVV
jgi:hypothetical protein